MQDGCYSMVGVSNTNEQWFMLMDIIIFLYVSSCLLSHCNAMHTLLE